MGLDHTGQKEDQEDVLEATPAFPSGLGAWKGLGQRHTELSFPPPRPSATRPQVGLSPRDGEGGAQRVWPQGRRV